MEDILLDTMFDLPTAQGVQEVVVNEEAVTTPGSKPLLIYADRKKGEPPPAPAEPPGARARGIAARATCGRDAGSHTDRDRDREKKPRISLSAP